MTKLLKIASDLSLPIEVVTEALAFLGRRGSGKTYAAQKLAEEMHRLQAQFVALDPVGIWYGLRLAADGKSPGLPVPVLGGLHGDIPLEVTGGALIADLVVDRGVSVVIDVSQFETDAAKARFAQAFADRFFFRKKASPSAVHVFLEECQEFIPQNPQGEETKMLHAFNRMVKIGRNFGIGLSMISQRPQEVNKKSLNLAEILFAFQMTGPQERKTVEGWISDKGIDEDIASELPKLERGEPHVWSPALLKISRRVRIDRKTTFDASSTPKVGKEAAARQLSPIDLQQLRTDMAATIEKAKAEDPKLLRAEIAKLKAEASKKPAVAPAPDPQALQRAEQRGRAEAAKTLKATADEISSINAGIASATTKLATLQLRLYGAEDALAQTSAPPAVDTSPRPRQAIQRAPAGPVAAVDGGGARRRVMIALAQNPEGLSGRKLSILADVKRGGSTWRAAMAALRRDQQMDDDGEHFKLNAGGLQALGDYQPLPTGAELREHWRSKMGTATRLQIFDAIVDAYPKAISADLVAQQAAVERGGSTWRAHMAFLRGLELVSGSEQLQASEELFDD